MAKQDDERKIVSAKELRDLMKDMNAIHQANIREIDKESNGINQIYNLRLKNQKSLEKASEQQEIINNNLRLAKTLTEAGYKIHGNTLNALKKEDKLQKKTLDTLNKKVDAQNALLASVKSVGKSFTDVGGSMRTFLMASDAAIKSVNLELGLSGERASIMRDNFEQSAQFAASMGIDMAGLTQMTSLYAEETGRARLHNEANLKSMTLIAKGTNLGVEGAAQMAGQYEMMGMNATDTASEVQRIVDTTERMGVNTGKVLKAVNKNFKALQKYTFKGGVQGMADMAIYAEKFKINMESVFEPMEKGRRLDSVIEMSAQLQVLGGQFANLADPMSMLFESRNDPEAYMKRINEMTKGMVTMNKTADGFNLEIASPMARDQLAAAAKALGMSTDELTTQALRMREIQQTRSQMFSKGFNKDEKDIIEGLAKFDKNTGRMMVEVGGVATDVSKLNTNQIKAMATEKSSLEARAKASQTFDQAFQNTIMELKATLLPMLKGVNEVLTDIRPIMKSFTEWVGKLMSSDVGGVFLKAAGMMMAGGILWKSLVSPLLMAGKTLLNAAGAGIGKAASSAGGAASKSMSGSQMLGKGKMMSAKGSGMMKGGLGIGAAGAGIGAGIGMAAVGISKLADSMAKLDKTQIAALPEVLISLGLAIAMVTIPLGIIAASASVTSLGLLAIGAAALGIGAGIGIAAMGIGQMAEGMALLKDVDMINIGLGIAAIGAGAMMGTLGLVGMAGMTASILLIATTADDMERVGNAFANIGAVMSGSAGDMSGIKDTINSISSMDVSSNSAIAGLTNMLSQPLKVEFSDKETAMVANIDLSVGDSGFMTEISKKVPINIRDLSQGN